MPLWEGDPTKEGGIPHGRRDEDTDDVTLGGAKVATMEYPDDESKMSAHDLGIHLPPPSYWPIVLALGITMVFGMLIFRNVDGPLHNLWMGSIAGILLTVYSIYRWAFEPGHGH